MKSVSYNRIVISLEALTPKQFNNLKGEIQKIDDRKLVANTLEANESVKCGHCGSKSYKKYGRRNDLQRYKCKKCGKTFNQLTGTPLARLRKKGRWIIYSDCLIKGLTLKQSAMLTGVCATTSFRWRHRMLKNTTELFPSSMNGVVESSETRFKYSEKGNRKPSSEAVEVNNNAPDVFVFSNVDRSSNVYNKILFQLKPELVDSKMMNLISKDILFVSNNTDFYNQLSSKFNLRHGKLDLINGEYVKKQIVHLKNVDDYNFRLHDWLSRFHGVATKYLVNYLGWFRELDEHKMNTPVVTRLVRAKSLLNKPYVPINN
jgi:transposase-like protein